MNAYCEKLQLRLADQGPQVLKDDAQAQEHLVQCGECYQFLESLQELDAAFLKLDPYDANDEVVTRALQKIEALRREKDEQKEKAIWKKVPQFKIPRLPVQRFVGFGLATATTAVVALLSVTMLGQQAKVTFRQGASSMGPEESAGGDISYGISGYRRANRAGNKERAAVDNFNGPVAKPEGEYGREEDDKYAFLGDKDRVVLSNERRLRLGYQKNGKVIDRQDLEPRAKNGDEIHASSTSDSLPFPSKSSVLEERKSQLHIKDKDQVLFSKQAIVGHELATKENEDSIRENAKHPDDDRTLDKSIIVERFSSRDFMKNQIDSMPKSQPAGVIAKAKIEGVPEKPGFLSELKSNQLEDPAVSEAKNFLSEQASLAGLQFKEAAGYWENTYIPGDPLIRFLKMRLAGPEREKFGKNIMLHERSKPAVQPFDSPKNSALAVYLHAEKTGIQEPTRMRIQVGLQGTERHGGKRPNMNVGLVLDLRDKVSGEKAAIYRALVSEFGKAKDVGDSFSLTVAGKAGGTVIEPKNFSYGQISVKLGELLGEDKQDGKEVDLKAAFEAARKQVSAVDDPNAPLGSSEIVLVTDKSLGGDLETLATLARESAVAGIPVSIIGIGSEVNHQELDRLVLSGQGNRRLIEFANDAEKVVDEELSSVSRVIARAIRLRIRLAPGVKLIDVLGSRRLDLSQAQQVRNAEKSIDQRIARNIGIAADRGDDEEGIQIVIPSFYAGDSHVILLDVVAGNPGPIADVTVRYKDLAYLKNGIEKANLTVGANESTPGQLERNVLKNLLSRKLAEVLENAGTAVQGRNTQEAVRLLKKERDLLKGMEQVAGEFQRDNEIESDIRMLDEYLLVLEKQLSLNLDDMNYVSSSLRYAGYMKTLPVIN